MTVFRAAVISVFIAIAIPVGILVAAGTTQDGDIMRGLSSFWQKAILRNYHEETNEKPVAADRLEVSRLTTRWMGDIESQVVDESSGLIASSAESHVLFTINDSGSTPAVHAMDHAGNHLTSWRVDYDGLHDFESLAAFSKDGERYLLIADTGDNLAWRNSVSLLAIKEPHTQETTGELAVEWIQHVRYPDRPYDVEGVAVADDRVYLLAKATVPPRLFSVPLASGDQADTAVLETHLTGIPQPTAQELLEDDRFGEFSSQPTGFDIDGRTAVVLTYRDAYLYRRRIGQSWVESFSSLPVRIPLPDHDGMEAVCLDGRGGLIVTRERQGTSRAGIFRVEL